MILGLFLSTLLLLQGTIFGNKNDPSQDFTAPSVTIAVPTNTGSYDNGTSATLTTLSGSSSDTNGVAICRYLNSTGGSGNATTSSNGSWTLSNLAIAVGTNVITITCLDPANNIGTSTLIVTRSAGVTGIDCSVSTCFYIRDGGTASVSGTGACVSTGSGNWNTANACDTFPATMIRGSSVYYIVADGSYTGKTFSTAASGTQVINIVKATTTDHGTETGWLTTYGDGEALFTGEVEFTAPYFTFDGKYGGGPAITQAGWITGYGFRVWNNGAGAVTRVSGNGGNIIIRHTDLQGNGGDAAGDSEGNDALQVFLPAGGDKSTTLEYVYAHDTGRCIFYINSSNATLTVSYAYTGLNESVPAQHSETVVVHASSTFIMRWSILTAAGAQGSTGGLIGGDDCGSCQIESYGNVYFRNQNWEATNGIIGTDSSASGTIRWKIYNNTFVDCDLDADTLEVTQHLGTSTGSASIANNYYYRCSHNNSNGLGTQTFNHFEDSGAGAGSSITTGTGDKFTSRTGFDFHLSGQTTAGTTLASPYNTDMFGCTRNNWTRGAVEFPAC